MTCDNPGVRCDHSSKPRRSGPTLAVNGMAWDIGSDNDPGDTILGGGTLHKIARLLSDKEICHERLG